MCYKYEYISCERFKTQFKSWTPNHYLNDSKRSRCYLTVKNLSALKAIFIVLIAFIFLNQKTSSNLCVKIKILWISNQSERPIVASFDTSTYTLYKVYPHKVHSPLMKSVTPEGWSTQDKATTNGMLVSHFLRAWKELLTWRFAITLYVITASLA